MISLLCPTRKRPDGLARMVESVRATARKNIEIVCYVDDDDNSYDALEVASIKFIHGPRIVLSNMWNKCAEVANGEILGQMNDDIIFRTGGWDLDVENEFAKWRDRIVLVHGSDGTELPSGSKGKFGPHPFVHRKWVETLGYFTAPFFSSDYGDTHLNDLANAIGRRRYLPFVIEHMHFWLGKGPQDQTSNDRLERHSRDNVDQLYKDLAPLREVDIEKLKAVMNK